ncbi:putative Dipeptidyl-peptidase [Blattamonas nauphoetae]|uniref:Dipeptidyl-peptidase n=1 Tax=Blattamonas nauphoetae TaxID=2049346 RepID=A0ABQ9XYN6_9EUKA|nr:putative Dipeptidyl-peptidase [Blattamonas nauphoetae]
MNELTKLGEHIINLDGTKMVYLTSKLTMETNIKKQNVFLENIGSSEPKALKIPYDSIHSICWTPKADLFSFITDSDGKSILCIYDISTDKVTVLKTFPIPISSVKWNNDGTHIVFTADVYPNKSLAQTRDIDVAKAKGNTDALQFDQLFVYQWDEWMVGKYSHVILNKVTPSETAPFFTLAANEIDVMPAADGDCPPKPSGSSDEYSFSPDGKKVAYTTQVGREQAWTLNRHVFVYDIETGTTKELPTGVGRCSRPTFNPTSDYYEIAFLQTNSSTRESAQNYIRIWESKTDTIRYLNRDIEDQIQSIVWSKYDPNTFHSIVNKKGRIGISQFSYPEGSILIDKGMACVSSFHVLPNADLLYSKSTFTTPHDLYHFSVANDTEIQLTFLNTEYLAQFAPMVPFEELWYVGANNDLIRAYYFPPQGHTTGKAPLMVWFHGGPEQAWTDDWSYRWNPQIICHQGYALIASDFHGSDSFSQDFTDSIIGRWGTWPYEDILKGVGYVLAHKPYLDPERIAGMGASYGGFMANWMQAHTKIFKALICHDGLFDVPTMYQETDQLYFMEEEHLGKPWEKGTTYEEFSPSYYTKNFATPELIFQGGCDYRVPHSQGIMAFTTLQGLGIPSRLVRFESENHLILNPYNSVRWHDEVIAWLRSYV